MSFYSEGVTAKRDARLVKVNCDPTLWPCRERVAHGPHHVRIAKAFREDGRVISYDCEGVKAHPATQIGRKK